MACVAVDKDIQILMEHLESIGVNIDTLLGMHIYKIDERLRNAENEKLTNQ